MTRLIKENTLPPLAGRKPIVKNKLLTASVAGALALLTVPAPADVIVSQTRNGNFIFNIDVNNGDTETVVPLDNAGLLQSVTLAVPANARFIVSYTAECAVDSRLTGASFNLDITAVNQATGLGIVLPPTNTAGEEDAFCTSNGNGFDGLAMNAVNAVAVNLPAGNYRIAVGASLPLSQFGEFVRGLLGDSSLIIWQ